MIAIDRSKLKAPANWKDRVKKALPDLAAFQREAQRFEKLGINTATRRKGFATFAPQALPKNSKNRPYFRSIWGASKDGLALLSHYKCAYCETSINARRSGQVEHFNPKSLFPLLAYDWDNYLLGCGGCNGAKADKWPQKGGYFRPDRANPVGKFRFEGNGEMKASKPRSAAGHTVKDLELNRSWLVQARQTALKGMLDELGDLAELHKTHLPTAVRLARRQLARLGRPELPYSAALTQCFVRAWNSACPESKL